VLYTLGILSQNSSDAFARNMQGSTSQAASKHFNNKAELSAELLGLLGQSQGRKCQVLVKGSRSAHMEYVVEDIIRWHANQSEASQSQQTQDNA